jgi:5-methylcytosine-specific restriction endonuclease McrA
LFLRVVENCRKVGYNFPKRLRETSKGRNTMNAKTKQDLQDVENFLLRSRTNDFLKRIETARDTQLKAIAKQKVQKLGKELTATGKRVPIREFLREYLLENPCLRCGNPNLMVLEFDHRNREEKSFSIADAVNQGIGLDEVKNELTKCDVLCANCHAIKTHMENDSWRYKTEALKFSGQL